jgi:hypothetical protein
MQVADHAGGDVQGFFELPSRGSGRPRPPDQRPRWLGPPEDSFGVLVPLRLVVVRTADLAVAIPSATGYRNGFGFELAIRRAAAEGDAFALDRTLHWLGREGSPPPEVLRVGVQFADGQKATSLESWWDYFDPQDAAQAPPPGPVLAPPPGPVLVPQGGAGGERVRSQSYWVWPLPPDGPLAFVVEWPALGVPLTQARVDGALIRQAAAQDKGLWPAAPEDA